MRRTRQHESLIAGLLNIAVFARPAADDVSQVVEFDEIVGLAAQVVRDHRRLRPDGRDDRHPHTPALQAFGQWTEIPVAREYHDVIDMRGELHGIHRQFDVMLPLTVRRPMESMYSMAGFVTME